MSLSQVARSGDAVSAADIEYRIAATRADRESAFRLVHRSYLNAGLAEPNPFGLRVTPYHLLETTEVFLARHGGRTICTLSLVADGQLGLPMESVYSSEVDALRREGFLVGEVSCLADRRDQFQGFFPIFVRLCRLMAQHAWRRGLSGLVAAVHPRHARFYRRYMHFEPIGGWRSYPSVCNRPAVALLLDFERIDRERPASFNTFFGEWLPEEMTEPRPITLRQRDYFEPMVDDGYRFVALGDAMEAASAGMPELACA